MAAEVKPADEAEATVVAHELGKMEIAVKVRRELLADGAKLYEAQVRIGGDENGWTAGNGKTPAAAVLRALEARGVE